MSIQIGDKKSCPFCGGEIRVRKYDEAFYHAALGGDFEWDPEYEIEHVDRMAAAWAKCPLEMAAYSSEAEAIAALSMRAERTCCNADDHKTVWFICSECGDLNPLWAIGNFCTNCGAKVVER